MAYSGSQKTARSYAQTFERLLKDFPKPDGEPWRGAEIEAATNNFVSQSYIASLRRGRIAQPGLEKLYAISRVMGFPVQLWIEDPRDWKDITAQQTSRQEQPSLSGLLDNLLNAMPDPGSGRPYTDRQISRLSQGRLGETEIRSVRAGHLDPLRDNLQILAETLGVHPIFWFSGYQAEMALEPEVLMALQDPRNRDLLKWLVDSGRSLPY